MNSLFASDKTVKPTAEKKVYPIPASSLMLLTNRIFCQIRLDTAYVEERITPEAIRYYASGLFWLRVIELRLEAQETLSPEEVTLRTMTKYTKFNIPEPLYFYYKELGQPHIIDGETFQAFLPELPIIQLGNLGGFFGRMDETPPKNVNLYSEYPTLGVCAEAICHAVSDEAPGPYASKLEVQQPKPTIFSVKNVQGYFNLAYRREEAKNFYRYLGITAKEFPESVESTGFNYELMLAVSHFFATTKTFPLQEIIIKSLSESGSQPS